LVCVITWTIKLGIVSIVELHVGPQGALITIGAHIIKKTLLLYLIIMLSGEHI